MTNPSNKVNWGVILDERQQKELELARLYARDFAHGTDGHGRLMLIDRLAETLEELTRGGDAAHPAPRHVLEFQICDVPYHSQWEADATLTRKDCGPACVEMVCKYITGQRDGPGTDKIMQHITGGTDRATLIKELQGAAQALYGVTLERYDGASWEDLKHWIGQGKPALLLVKYGSYLMRMDRNYIVGHYLVGAGWDAIDYQGMRVERLIVHDPDFYGDTMTAQGAFIPITQAHLMKMWDDCYLDKNPRRMVLVPK